MLRWQTAGESHGEALVAMIEGVPAGVEVTSDNIRGALARRRLGYGRGARSARRSPSRSATPNGPSGRK